MNRKTKEINSHYTTNNMINYTTSDMNYYKKGYADGYRRREKIHTVNRNNNQYIFYVILIIASFIILVATLSYLYPTILGRTNYKDNCLLDLTSTYSTYWCSHN
jgi:hypothetical protein